MAIITVTPRGIGGLRLRLELARAALVPAINGAIRLAGEQVAQELSDAAPHGATSGEGTPPGNDAPGPLHASFHTFYTPGSGYASTAVFTTQPRKLGYVRYGRGPVYPVNKRALMWPGLAHPVKSARATQPNEFVQPALERGTHAAFQLLRDVSGEAITVLRG